MCPEADYTEHNDTGKNGREGICETDDEGVDQSVVARFGVAGQSYQGTEGETEREEDLSGSFKPNLRREGLSKLQEKEREREIGWGYGERSRERRE